MAYVGSVGTGLTVKWATVLRRQLNALTIDKPTPPLTNKGMVRTQPIPPAEIAFRG